ncbi:MAG: SPASM domain-containing protein [Ruminococcus sp.]|nr:SPASM domain-containing protein [Ruminococcus sp.]
MPEIIDYLGHGFKALAEKYGAKFTSTIHTNAYLLNQKTVGLLEDVGCYFALVTIDGYGALHDKTRYLRGGGATYAKIIENLSGIKTSMIINIRSNLHKGSADSYDKLREEIMAIAAKTGNEMRCSPARVHIDAAKNSVGIEELTAEEYHSIAAKTDLSERLGVFSPTPAPCHIVKPDDYVIDDMGFVFPHCNELAADQSTAFCNITELDESSFDIIEKRHAEFIEENLFPDHEKCLNCAKLPVCMGGCALFRKYKGEPACPENLSDPDAFILKKYYSAKE